MPRLFETAREPDRIPHPRLPFRGVSRPATGRPA